MQQFTYRRGPGPGSGNRAWKRSLITRGGSSGGGGGSDFEGRNGGGGVGGDAFAAARADETASTAARMARVGRDSPALHPRKRRRDERCDGKSEASVDLRGGIVFGDDFGNRRGSAFGDGRTGVRGHNSARRGGRASTGWSGGGRGGVGHPVAKRIRLDQPTEGTNITKEATVQNATEAVKGKLTDFAYVETSKTSGRGRGGGGGSAPERGGGRARFGGRGGRGGGSPPLPSSHMGLVRVRTELSSARTPVCPTFARGLLCSNPTCLRRHDVPPECAVPLCSYFQRDGRCLKMPPLGKCPFRHVKVNPNVAVCPSFEKLGYCEDLGCQLRHVRAKRGGQWGVGGREGSERAND